MFYVFVLHTMSLIKYYFASCLDRKTVVLTNSYMGLDRGVALVIYFAAGVLLFLCVAFCAFLYECVKHQARYIQSSKTS